MVELVDQYRHFAEAERKRIITIYYSILEQQERYDEDLRRLREEDQLLLIWIDGHPGESEREYKLLGENHVESIKLGNKITALGRQRDDMVADHGGWIPQLKYGFNPRQLRDMSR